MSFPRIDVALRTDASFRNREDLDHHKTDSIIEKLPIDMVKDFVVADALHLVDLGLFKLHSKIFIARVCKREGTRQERGNETREG